MGLSDKLQRVLTAAKALAGLAIGQYDTTQVPAEVFAQRIAQCKNCPKYNSILGTCNVCGCLMSLKARLEFDPVETSIKGEKTKTVCPESLW